MKTPKIIVGALVVYCIVVLLIGMANAADLARPATGDHFTGRAGPFAPQKIIGRLEQQGVDVTEALTALQKGDTAAVKAWLTSFFEAHKCKMAHARPIRDPGAVISRLEQQGVDVTEVKAALQNHDMASVKAWLDPYLRAHKDAKVACHPVNHPAGKNGRQS